MHSWNPTAMLSRRELVRHGLVLSAAGGLAPGILSAHSLPAGVWIVDRQMQAAPAIAAVAEAGTAEILTFTADPGQVWMHVLEPRLKAGPFAIGGYTSASVLFCLHYLARSYGLGLAGLGEGLRPPATIASDSDALVDLRDPRFGDRRTAYTWLMQPRRV
jgi:hypothetical protein